MITKERRYKTEKIIKKRVKQIKLACASNESENKDLKEPHRLSKKTAFGCKKPSCNICRHKKPQEETQI